MNSTSALQATAQKAGQAEVVELKQGYPIERELAGGEVHSYRIALNSGQYLKTLVEQKGIDVVVKIVGPNGQKLTEVDNDPLVGTEAVSVVADASGEYRLDVESSNQDAKPGRYEIKIEELRDSKPQDQVAAAAQRAFEEAVQLRSQQTAEARRQAIKKYEEALPLWREVGNKKGEAYALNESGVVYSTLGDPKKALEQYEQAVLLFRNVGDGLNEANTLTNQCLAYWRLGDQQKALQHCRLALPLARAAGDRKGEGTTLNAMGAAYERLGEVQKALESYSEVLSLWRAIGNRQGEASVLSNIGAVYYNLGQPAKALEYFDQALPLRRATRDRQGETVTLLNIGGVYARINQMQRALEFYNQALELSRATGDRRIESYALGNIGSLYQDWGEPKKALEYNNLALPLKLAVGDGFGRASTLNNIGVNYVTLSDLQKALDYFSEALALRRTIGDRSGEGQSLASMGNLYKLLGEPMRALDYYNQAVQLSRATGDRRTESNVLGNIGSIHQDLSDPQKALAFHNEALPLKRAVGDRLGEANTLSDIGASYLALNEPKKALGYFDQALSIRQDVGNRYEEVYSLLNIGDAHSLMGEPQKAIEYQRKALELSLNLGNKLGEAKARYGLARNERSLGNLTEARNNVEAAINIIESTRTTVTSQDLRASYLAINQRPYEMLIDLLITMHREEAGAGYDAVALQVSERARARSLLETLTEARADIRQGVDAVLLERERILRQQLSARSERLARLLGGKHTEDQATASRRELETLLADYQEVEAQVRAKSPRYAALTQPQPLNLKEIQEQVLDENTLLLEYALGEERSYLWAVTPNSTKIYELPKRAEIEATAGRVYDLLVAKADALYPEALTALSEMLLRPVAKELGRKRLLIVSEGKLQYVPFGALFIPTADGRWQVAGTRRSNVSTRTARSDGQANGNKSLPPATIHPLILDHEIVSLPSASVLAVLRRELATRKPAAKVVAVLADPVFEKNDQRVRSSIKSQQANDPIGKEKDNKNVAPPSDVERSTRDLGLNSFDRLLLSRGEAELVAALASKGHPLVALDFTASRATAINPDLDQYQIVHFATHSLINNQHPELSGIVLSLVDEQGQPQDGFLRLYEIYNLKLNANLVVLSACQTALGKEIKGEGLIGLTRGFMYAGVPRVVASLWKVSDKATAELMKRFYEKMLRDGLRPAAALRAAQVSMLKAKQWSAAYYWAGFVLQGEWR